MQKFTLLTCLAIITFNCALSQSVGINATGAAPDSSAMLDVRSSSKGLLAPRMTTANMNAIAGPAKGLLIYNITNNQLWTNTGTAMSPNWKTLTAAAWGITGNTGTIAGTNFIGTTDNVPLIFRTNNIFSGGIDPVNFNSFFGYRAGESLTTGQHNVAIGARALNANQTTDYLVAIGDSALYAQNGGNGKTIAIGVGAGRSNTTGAHNSFLGYGSGHENTIGRQNTSLGSLSMYANTNGYSNTAIGYKALYAGISDSNNVVIGNSALSYGVYIDDYRTENVIIGDSAYFGVYYSASRNTILGHAAARDAGYGNSNTLIGYQAMGSNSFLGTWNVAIGYQPMYNTYWGIGNVSIGKQSLYNNDGGGNYNVAIGSESFYSNTTGYDGVAIGQEACWSNTTGMENIGIGKYALYTNTEADRNIAIGDSALYDLNNGGGQNTAIGTRAGYSITTGDHNCFFGSQAARLSTTGDYNVAIGYLAMDESLAGDGNTCVGRQAGDANELGANNTLIGAYTDVDADGYTGSTALGHNANITASLQVRIGQILTGSIGGYQNWSNISDGRYKKNIRENVPGLDFILLLKPVTYQLDIPTLQQRLPGEESDDPTFIQQRESEIRTGFIAQEVEGAAQSIGYVFSGVDTPKNEQDMYGLRYAEFVVPLVKAVQEQQQQIELLSRQNAELLSRLETLETRQ